MELVQRLLNEGFELVLQDCGVWTVDLSYLDQHFPKKLNRSYDADMKAYLVSGSLTKSTKLRGQQVPSHAWKGRSLHQITTGHISQTRPGPSAILRYPSNFERLGLRTPLWHMLKIQKAKCMDCGLAKHWSSLSEVPQSAKICDFVRTTLGNEALDLLETPGNWKLLANDDLPLDKALDRDN